MWEIKHDLSYNLKLFLLSGISLQPLSLFVDVRACFHASHGCCRPSVYGKSFSRQQTLTLSSILLPAGSCTGLDLCWDGWVQLGKYSRKNKWVLGESSSSPFSRWVRSFLIKPLLKLIEWKVFCCCEIHTSGVCSVFIILIFLSFVKNRKYNEHISALNSDTS